MASGKHCFYSRAGFAAIYKYILLLVTCVLATQICHLGQSCGENLPPYYVTQVSIVCSADAIMFAECLLENNNSPISL